MTDKLQAQLTFVEAVIAVDRATVEKHRATWRHQCANGMFGAAEATEEFIIATERSILRHTVRREYLQEQINQPALETP